MKYVLEHVNNLFGSFWVIYEDNGREVFYSRNIETTLKVLKDLRGE